MKFIILLISILVFINNSFTFSQNLCLNIPDTVCVNTPVTLGTHCIYNTQYWNFCDGLIDEQPLIFDRGTLPFMNSSVRIAVAEDNGIYYAFWTNFFNGNLTKCVFGNSLRNVPVTYDLGNIDSLFTSLNEGIQIIKENGNWYAFIVGSGDKFVRIDFGTSLDNPAPTANLLATIGNMGLPHGLYLFKENGIWMGLVANANNNSFTRIVFPDSLTGNCTYSNSGTVPGVSYPTSIYPVKENDSCYAIVTSKSSNEIYTFNFGDSYMNNQMNIINHGNVGSVLNEPFDVVVIRDCDKSFGVVSCKYHMTKITMPQGVGGTYSGTTLFNGYVNRAEGISNAIRQGDSLYFLVASAGNRLTVLSFGSCTGLVPSYNETGPSEISFPDVATYQVSLFLNEGQYDQISECSTVTAIPEVNTPFLTIQNDSIIADPADNISWYFNGQIIPFYHESYMFPVNPGQYFAINSNTFCESDTSNMIDIVGINENTLNENNKWHCSISDEIINVCICKDIKMPFQVDLYDLSGRLLQKQTLNSCSKNEIISFSINNYCKSIYIIKLSETNAISVKKLSIIK